MKVRLTTFARPDKDLLNRFSRRYLGLRTTWKDLEFVTDESYDRLVILTYPYKDTLERGYDSRKAITFMTEPSVSFYAKPHPSSRVLDVHLHLPFLPKEIYGDRSVGGTGKIIDKTKLFSCVVSELAAFSGHKARLEFVYALDKIVEEGLDIYGRPSHGKFFALLNNYKGFLKDKYEGLWEYAYHFACENTFEKGYFTEKLIDPIISETLCFYDGCPDIERYVDPRAFVKINVNHIEYSIETIVKAISDNSWDKQIPFLLKEKRRFLTDLHPFNIIWMAVHEKDVNTIYN